MENLSFGQILLLIAFIVVPLIKFLLQRAGRRLKHQTPNSEAVNEVRRQAQATAVPPLIPRATRREAQEPIVDTTLPRTLCYKELLLGNARDVRRGMICSDNPGTLPHIRSIGLRLHAQHSHRTKDPA